MVIAFITCILTSGDADQPQMGNRKSKAMSSGPRRYDRVAKAYKQQAPDTVGHELNSIGVCEMVSSVDTCCAGKNWSLLSRTG